MFHVGQKVVFIGTKERCPDLSRHLVAGDVYTVRWVSHIDYYDRGVIDLVEIPRPETDEYYRGYNQRYFRPVVEPKADVSFTVGAPLDSERWDNRRKVKEPAR